MQKNVFYAPIAHYVSDAILLNSNSNKMHFPYNNDDSTLHCSKRS